MKKLYIVFILCVFAALSVPAQEGMWMLTQLKQLDLQSKGLLIPTEKLYSPDKPCLANAVLQLGGGSASFVSSEGLIVTNHHVAYTALQRASSVSNDYLTNGFLAKEHSQELQAPGYRAKLMLAMEDVTDEILKAAEGATNVLEKEKKINVRIAELTEQKKGDVIDREVEIASMYNGKQYVMYTYKVFKDIRIVYAPPHSIGNYGGETDNWMWPRHTGDFSFLRVYVSPDGKGNEFSEKNIPYKPEVWLKVAKGDLDEGDFNFVIGYPGFTTRYRTSNSVAWNLKYNYPFFIKNFKEIISLAEGLTKDDPDGKLKVANLTRGLANTMKNYQGKIDGMKNTKYLQKKLDFEKEFMNWANSNSELKNKYADILSKIKEQYDVIEHTKERDNMLNFFNGLSGTMFTVASQIYYIAREMEKPMEEREQGLTEDALDRFADRLTYIYNDYYEPLDKAMLLRALKMAALLPENQRIRSLDSILTNSEKKPEQWINEAYNNTKLKDPEFVKNLVGKSPTEIEKIDDPFIHLAITIYPIAEEMVKINKTFAANIIQLRKNYIDALYEWKGSTMYPDANSTIRFTWGPVKGYKPQDAVWYSPFTTLQGVLDKNTSEDPFNAPAELFTLAKNKDYGNWSDPELRDVPVAFLNQCDITGGNSGSPVMNAKGEIIGIAFDGNYEAMISDWQYDYNLQRCIAVDMRYVLFVTEKFGKAGFILNEMGL